MRNIIVFGVVLGVVGLVVGYLIFARTVVGSQLIPVDQLFVQSDNLVSRLSGEIRGVETIRRNILLTGGGGVVLGMVLGALAGRR